MYNASHEMTEIDSVTTDSESSVSSKGFTAEAIATPLSDMPSITRQLPKMLGALVLSFDVLAMIMAFLVSLELPTLLPDWIWPLNFQIAAVDLQARLYCYASICIFFLGALASKGHYTQRVPWWSQVQMILKFAACAIILDGFIYFTVQKPFSRYLIFGNWALVVGALLLARQISFLIMSRMKTGAFPLC